MRPGSQTALRKPSGQGHSTSDTPTKASAGPDCQGPDETRNADRGVPHLISVLLLLLAMGRVCACSVATSCPTLWDPMDCSPSGSSAHGILQARILEWVAIPFSRGSSRPRDWNCVSRIAGRFFTLWATGEADTAYLQGKLIRIEKTFKGSFPLANPNSISGDLSQEFKRYKVFWTKMFISLLFIIV